jgi:hypothetical protein
MSVTKLGLVDATYSEVHHQSLLGNGFQQCGSSFMFYVRGFCLVGYTSAALVKVKVKVKVKVTLRLAVYRQAVRLGVDPFETHDQRIFLSN